MAQITSADLAVDPKQTLHFRVTRAMLIFFGLGTVAMAVIAMLLVTITATYLNVDMAGDYARMMAPKLKTALEQKASHAVLTEKVGSFGYLGGIAYGALLDGRDDMVVEWRRDIIGDRFDPKMAKRMKFDNLTRKGSLYYYKVPLDRKREYSILVGVHPISILLDQLTQYLYLYVLFLVGACVIMYLAHYLVFIQHVFSMAHRQIGIVKNIRTETILHLFFQSKMM